MTTPNVSCPSGGTFYACSTGSRYVGCCLTNPCSTGCFAGQLVPAAFDPAQYGEFPDQQCSSGAYYTCIYASQNNATFLGCCGTNACSGGGCPSAQLAGAFLSNNPSEAAAYLVLNSTWVAAQQALSSAGSSSSSSGSLTSSTSAAAAAATASSLSASATLGVSSTTSLRSSASTASVTTGVAAAATASPSSTGAPVVPSNVGAIAGGAAGGAAVLVALIVGLVCLRRRKRQSVGTQPAASPQTQHAAEKGVGQTRELDSSLAKAPLMSTYTASSMSPPQGYSPGPPGYVFENARHQSHELVGSPIIPLASPGPPGYVVNKDTRHLSHELAGDTHEIELDGGQRYHAYRPARGLGIQDDAS